MSSATEILVMMISVALVFGVLHMVYDPESSRRMHPEYRELNNKLYEAQERQSTVLLLHF